MKFDERLLKERITDVWSALSVDVWSALLDVWSVLLDVWSALLVSGVYVWRFGVHFWRFAPSKSTRPDRNVFCLVINKKKFTLELTQTSTL